MRIAPPNLYRFAETKKPASEETTAGKSDQTDEITLGKRRASWMTDAIAVAQFAGSGYLYNEAAKEAATQLKETPAFSDAPIVRLEDPLLVAPGWTTQPEKFDNFVEHLLKNPENGARAVYLKEGQAFTDKECQSPTEVTPDDKVFLAVYDDVLSPPDKTAPQLAQAVEQIREVQGPKIDVVGYSLGGIAVRKMLDQGDETLDQVAFLGTGHQGSRFADLASYIIKRDIGFAMKLANVNATHLPAMSWMAAVIEDDPDSSPALRQLNGSFQRQKERVTEMINIGSDGLGTITKSWGGTLGGDGLVPARSLTLADVPTVVLSGRGTKQHGNLPSDTDAFNEMKEFFGWETA